MKSPRNHALVGLLGAALVTTALPAATLAQAGDLTPEGVEWKLTLVEDMSVPADVEATLYMEGGEANGSTGCNSFSATYALDGQSLTFDENIAMTQAFCDGAAGEVEQAYLEALPTVVGWDSDGQELALLDSGQGLALVFDAVSPAVDLTEADIEALITELERLNQRINNTRRDVRSLQVPKLRERVAGNEAVLGEVSAAVVNQDVPSLRDRVVANEAVLGALTKRFINVRLRVRDLEGRVAALEAATFAATPSEE